jgi:hypothetical protein
MTESATPTEDPLTEGDTRKGRRLRYEYVLDEVADRTGDGMPASISAFDLKGRLHRRGIRAEDMDSAIKAAKQHDELIEFTGPEGRPHLALNTVEAIRDVIEEESERDHPDQQLIGRLNMRVQTLQEGDDD